MISQYIFLCTYVFLETSSLDSDFTDFFFPEVVFLLSFRKGTLVTEIPDGKRVREVLKPRKNLSCSTACQPYKVQRVW